MSHRFRIRVDLARGSFVDVDSNELIFSPEDDAPCVRLIPADGDRVELLKEARSLALVGGEFAHEAEARAALPTRPFVVRDDQGDTVVTLGDVD